MPRRKQPGQPGRIGAPPAISGAEIAKLFRKHWPKERRFPSDYQCEVMGEILRAIPKHKAQESYRKPAKAVAIAARALLREIELVRQGTPDPSPCFFDLSAEQTAALEEGWTYRLLMEPRRALDAAEAGARRLLASFDRPEPEPARFIRDQAIRAWADAEKSLPADDNTLAMQAFVAELLVLCGEPHVSTEAIRKKLERAD